MLFRSFIIVFAVIYTVVLAVLSLLNILLAYPPTWVVLPNILTPLWFLPFALFLPLTFFLRSLWLGSSTTLLFLLFVLLFGNWFLPRTTQTEGAMTIKFVTFNSLANNANLEGILAILRAHNADIIALQELSPTVAAGLSKFKAFPYKILEPHVPGSSGFPSLGLLSRYPLEADSYVFDPNLRFQRAVVVVNGTRITVVNVHLPVPFRNALGIHNVLPLSTVLSYNTEARDENLSRLLDVLTKIEEPLVVLGDFNLSDFEVVYQDFSARFRNLYRTAAANFGFTFPNRGLPFFPFLRLDHIWVKGPLAPFTAGVDCRSTGSDHCVLWGEVAIQQN